MKNIIHTSIIYILTNIVANKVYIGKAKHIRKTIEKSLRQRSGKDGIAYMGSPRLWNSIEFHGWENFKYEVLNIVEDNKDEVLVSYWEDYYINMFDSRNPERGYNLKEGGSGGAQAEETKQKLHNIRIGKKLDEDTKLKISNSQQGKKHSEETKNIMRQNALNMSKDHKRKLSEAQTGKLNHRYGTTHISVLRKLDFKEAEKIRELYKTGNFTQIELAIMYDIPRATAGRIIRNETYIR